MENTDKVLFDDPTPQWYVAVGQSTVGPLAAADVYRQIEGGQLSWANFIWKEGQPAWERICDVKVFQAATPKAPPKKPEIKPAAKRPGGMPPLPGAEEANKVWFLHYNDSQFGPFTVEDVGRFLQAGKIHGGVHGWRDGMDGWKSLQEIEEFADAAEGSKSAWSERKKGTKAKESDQRGGPRRPLVARVLLANEKSVSAAVCRDVSVGGMQVLTDKIPGQVGTRLKLNVSPAGSTIKPFVAEGVVVRILEDGLGFSFRFDGLDAAAKKAIESYIASAS